MKAIKIAGFMLAYEVRTMIHLENKWKGKFTI